MTIADGYEARASSNGCAHQRRSAVASAARRHFRSSTMMSWS
jgi:hypothetical protein